MNRISVFACTLHILHGSPLNEESALHENFAYGDKSNLDKTYKSVSTGITRWFKYDRDWLAIVV